MKKIAVVTGARSEYGLLRWVIDEIHHATRVTVAAYRYRRTPVSRTRG